MKTSRVPVGRSVACRSPLSSDTSPPAARAAFWQMLPLLIKVYCTSLAVGLERRLWWSQSVGSEDRNWPEAVVLLSSGVVTNLAVSGAARHFGRASIVWRSDSVRRDLLCETLEPSVASQSQRSQRPTDAGDAGTRPNLRIVATTAALSGGPSPPMIDAISRK